MEGQVTFAGKVIGNSLYKSKVKETPSVIIRVRTEYDIAIPERPLVQTVTGNLWLTYKTIKKTVSTLQEVFGWQGENISDFNEPILVGKRCEIVCETEEYEGEERLKIKFFNRPGGLSSMDVSSLATLINDVQPMVDKMLHDNRAIDGTEEEVAKKETETMPATSPINTEEEELPF